MGREWRRRRCCEGLREVMVLLAAMDSVRRAAASEVCMGRTHCTVDANCYDMYLPTCFQIESIGASFNWCGRPCQNLFS